MIFNCISTLVILIFTAGIGVIGADKIESVVCPFPEGESGQSEENCNGYSACEFSNGVCHMKRNEDVGYIVMSEPMDTGKGWKVELSRANKDWTLFGGDVLNLSLEVIYHEEYHVQIKITDSDTARYEVPIPMSLPIEPVINSMMYNVTVSNVGQPLVLRIVRNNGNIIFKSVASLTYEDQFLQINTEVASTYLYGFGENYHDSLKHSFEPRTTQAIFTRDQNSGRSNLNSYGAHPYHMVVEDDAGNSHSVLLLTSNAMEYSTFMMTNDDDTTTPALTYRTIGGIIDMHFFMGPTPEEVNQQYISMIGLPLFPPYWALGFHLSRWGYENTAEIRALREEMKEKGIPQDVQTFDIDYLDGRRDFTIDPLNYGDMDVLIDELHNDGLKATVILDPAIATEFSTYPPSERGLFYDAYIKWADQSYVPANQPAGALNYVVGNVWPASPTVFPDYLKPSTQDWWFNEILLLHQKINFDSLWIDMNEPSNFDQIAVGDLVCPTNQWDDPPYPTKAGRGGAVTPRKISDRTICMSTIQTDGTNEYSHYDVHSLYGWSQAEPTSRAMNAIHPRLRPMVMSRSTFVGSGKYVIHWLGDNFAEWGQMKISIIAMLEFNMFGIPFTGADVCGFVENTSEELCGRWTQLGAFYPFNRNHNSLGYKPQDPTQWESVTEIAKTYLSLRYMYNPYLYLLLHKASIHGNSVVRPLFNVFPNDVPCREVDDQFMWGDAIMVAPVLEKGVEARDVYFPMGVWYDLETGEKMFEDITGNTVNVSAPITKLPVFLRGGQILPWQKPEMTTIKSRLNPFGLTVSIENETAEGMIFWDDGESLYENPMTETYEATISYQTNILTLTMDHGEEIISGWTLDTVILYGYTSSFSYASVNGEPVMYWNWDQTLQILTLTFSAPMDKDITLLLTS